MLDLSVFFHLHSNLISSPCSLHFDLPGLLWWWCRYRRYFIWLTIDLRRNIIPKQRITPVMAKNTGSSISAEVGLVVTWRKIRADINKLSFVYPLLCFKICCFVNWCPDQHQLQRKHSWNQGWYFVFFLFHVSLCQVDKIEDLLKKCWSSFNLLEIAPFHKAKCMLRGVQVTTQVLSLHLYTSVYICIIYYIYISLHLYTTIL